MSLDRAALTRPSTRSTRSAEHPQGVGVPWVPRPSQPHRRVQQFSSDTEPSTGPRQQFFLRTGFGRCGASLMAAGEALVCEFCSGVFARRARGPAARFCSANCRVNAARSRWRDRTQPARRAVPVALICEQCGASFVGRRNRVVCSQKCRNRRDHESRQHARS